MKIRLFSIFTLAGLLLGSCTVDEIPTEGGSIIAEMETDQTRTAVTDAGSFTWSAGDQVWLHTTSGSVVGTLSDGAGSSDAKFSYDAFIGEMTGKAAYPYNAGHSVSGDVLNFVLPASYDLGSSLTNTNAAMYGVNVGGTIKFNHLAGVMRFKFKNVPAGVNQFVITLDKKINGTFTADLTADYPVIETSSTSTASEKAITLNFNALTTKSDISVYVPLPIGTYNSLELGLYDDDQSVWTYSKSVTNTVNRKSLKLMPVVTLGGSVDGDLEGGGSEILIDYVDEYGENHGPGVKIDETVWAPVNCGYHKEDFKYGKLYQWGRKYGHGYDGSIYNLNGDEIGTYSDAYSPKLVVGPVSLATGQSKANEDKFYYKSYPYDWCDTSNGNMWNSGSESIPIKTEYDPCPDGWRVPTYAELYKLKNNYSSRTTDKNGQVGYWFSGASSYSETIPQVFLPIAGSLSCNDGSANHRGNTGGYWASGTFTSSGAYRLGFHNSKVSMDGSYGRAIGYSVRCVQDNGELIPVTNVSLDQSTLTLAKDQTKELVATILPADANHTSAHWWSDNTSVATVDQNGKVTAVAVGTTTITAMAGMQAATCEVTVLVAYVDEYGVNHGPGVKIGETVWAPVNCGYHKTDFKYGKLYQWGRKYGQGYDTDKVAPTIQKGRVSLEVGQAEENSNCFYTNDSLPFDWLLSSRSDLWNGGTDEVPVKTEYDPCPKGWRVPTYTEFQTITHLDHPTWTTDDSGLEGYLFTGKSACSEEVRQVFFIATGYRFGEKGTNSQPATHGTYWTSTPYPITYNCSTYYFYFNSMWAEVDMGSYSRSNGLTVRCVQE